MIWHTNTVNIDIETGEMLTNLKNYIKIKSEKFTTFKDHNHATVNRTNFWRRDAQRTITFWEPDVPGWDELP